MEKKQLEEFYGILLNFINKEKDIDDWQELTDEH